MRKSRGKTKLIKPTKDQWGSPRKTEHCRNCYHADPQRCEALSLSLPADVLASYEACDCPCHYEQDDPKDAA